MRSSVEAVVSGMQSAQRSAMASRLSQVLVEGNSDENIADLREEALENGLKSAQRSQAMSRMEKLEIDHADSNTEKLVKSAIDQGMISAERSAAASRLDPPILLGRIRVKIPTI